MTPPKRFAVYARQSLDRTGEAAAVDRQLVDCRRLAADNGWTIAEEYVDNDVSATSRKPRPEWERLLGALRAGEYDGILCWHTDRLYRRIKDLLVVLDIAAERPLQIVSVKLGGVDLSTPAGQMLAKMLASVAEYEVQHKGARQVAANRQRAQAGHLSWTRRPFGYDKVDGIIVVIESEAAELRRMAQRVIDGWALTAIIRDLNDRGVPTSTGGRWGLTTLRRLLQNPRLIGEAHYQGGKNGQVYKAAWPPILEPEVQAIVSAILRDPTRRKNTTNLNRHLLSGIARCGICGKPMMAAPHRRTGMALRCRTPHLSRVMAPVEEVVEQVVIRRLSRPDAAVLFAADVDVESLQVRAADIRERRAGLAQLVADHLLGATEVRGPMEKLSAELREVESHIQAAMGGSPAATLAGADDVAARWAELSLQDKRAVVNELIEVTVLPSPHKGARFAPEQVRVEWRNA